MLNMTFSGLLSTVNPIDAITERMFAFGASLTPLLCGLGRIILYENKYILKIHRGALSQIYFCLPPHRTMEPCRSRNSLGWDDFRYHP